MQCRLGSKPTAYPLLSSLNVGKLAWQSGQPDQRPVIRMRRAQTGAGLQPLCSNVCAVRRFPVLVLALSTTGLYSILTLVDACEMGWDAPRRVLSCS